MATDGDDPVVDRGARRGRLRRPQPMATDRDDAVDDAVVNRGARCGRARSSSTPAGRRPPRGTTGVCLVLVGLSRWRPTDTTRWCPAEGFARQSRRVHRPHKQTMPPRPPLDGRAGCNRRVRPSPFRLGRGEGRGGKCRRVRQPVQASEAPFPTGTRGGRGREVQAVAAAPSQAGT